MQRSRFLGAVSAAAVTAPAAVAVARAQDKPSPVRIGIAFSDAYAETTYALDGGFFQRAGIDAQTTFFTNSQAQVQAVAGNAIDVGMADVIQIGNAINGGVPLTVLAGGALYTPSAPTTLLCVAKSSPVKTAKDLEGGTIAVVSLAAVGPISVQRYLAARGADPAKVKLTEMPFPSMAAAIARGTVTAALIGEPFLTAGKPDLRALADTYPFIAPSFYVSLSFASRDWVSRNRELARKVTRAIVDAGTWANAHHEETAQILAKRAKLDLDVARPMNRVVYATAPPDRRLIQPVIDVGVTYHLMNKPLPAAQMLAPL